jgi:hypothetical protein
VITGQDGRVMEIQGKQIDPQTNWVWGAFKMPGSVLHSLYDLWLRRNSEDEYIGSLVNAWLASGGRAWAFRAGQTYFDVGTMDGYMEAMQTLAGYRKAAI